MNIDQELHELGLNLPQREAVKYLFKRLTEYNKINEQPMTEEEILQLAEKTIIHDDTNIH